MGSREVKMCLAEVGYPNALVVDGIDDNGMPVVMVYCADTLDELEAGNPPVEVADKAMILCGYSTLDC